MLAELVNFSVVILFGFAVDFTGFLMFFLNFVSFFSRLQKK
jgi:hypothetical protein